jgi:hypothetical protein
VVVVGGGGGGGGGGGCGGSGGCSGGGGGVSSNLNTIYTQVTDADEGNIIFTNAAFTTLTGHLLVCVCVGVGVRVCSFLTTRQ